MAAISWTSTPTMYEITLPSGNTYYIKDYDVTNWIGDGTTSGAEKRLSDAESAIAALSNATHWIGITTTTLTDGSTTNPITINGQSVTAVSGDIVQDSGSPASEFIFNGTAWQAFGGSIGTLGSFAYVDEGEATFTPSGSNAASAVTLGTPTTESVTPLGSAGTAPTLTFAVANENLTIDWDAGSAATAGTAVSVVTALPSTGNTAAAQTFSGTAQTITVTPKSST